MKKNYLKIIAVAVIMGIMVTLSCSKKDEAKSCTCTEFRGNDSETQVIDPASFGASNCSDLVIKLRIATKCDECDYSCK